MLKHTAQPRRTFLKRFAAFLGGAATTSQLRADSSSTDLNVTATIDIDFLNKQITALKDPTYVPLPTGVLGSTYFKVGASPRFPHDFGIRLFLDDIDVTDRSVEADCIGDGKVGWVRMFDVDANGRRITRSSLQKTGAGRFATAHDGRIRTYYGKVKLRKTHPAKHEQAPDAILGFLEDGTPVQRYQVKLTNFHPHAGGAFTKWNV